MFEMSHFKCYWWFTLILKFLYTTAAFGDLKENNSLVDYSGVWSLARLQGRSAVGSVGSCQGRLVKTDGVHCLIMPPLFH